MSPDELKKVESTFIDYYASVAVEKFKLRNFESSSKHLDIDASAISQIIKDQKESLDINKSHLLRLVVEHKEHIQPNMADLKQSASDQVANILSNYRHTVQAHLQQESEKMLVGRWLNDNDVFRSAKSNLEDTLVNGAMSGTNVKQAINAHLTSRLTELYQLAVEQFGHDMSLSQQVVVPFGAKEKLGLENHPRASLGDLKNTVDSLNNEGIISLNANEIIRDAAYNNSQRSLSNSDVIKELMNEISADLPLGPKEKGRDADDMAFNF